MSESAKNTTIIGVVQGFLFQKNGFCIASLADKTTIKGNADEASLVRGMTYEFFGKWKEDSYGPHFRFEMFVVRDSMDRGGVVQYLSKYAENIGPVYAGRLFDEYGSDAVKRLRSNPQEVAATLRIPVDRCMEAAKSLQKIVKFENTKIELATIFQGRGFPGKAIEELIDKFGLMAPSRIKKNPFVMLTENITGAGFLRCDRLYLDLGHNPSKLRRQLFCLWHAMKDDGSGHTWFSWREAVTKLVGSVGRECEARPRMAIRMGRRIRWLAIRKDDAGELWIADQDKANEESYLAKKIVSILRRQSSDRQETTQTPGDCTGTRG